LRWLDAEDEALGSLHASQNHENVDVVRVVIVETRLAAGKGVARRLEDAGFEIVARTGDADDLLRRVRALSPTGIFHPSSEERGDRTHERP